MPGLSQTILFKIVASLIAIFITILIAALIYIPQQIERFAIQDATKTATNMVGQYKTLRGYYTKNVIKKVLEGSDIKPTFNHANDPKAIPLPATLIHELSALTDTSDIRLNLYSKFPFPNRADRRLDEFQTGAWEQLLKDPQKEVMTVTQNGSDHFVKVAIADTMSAEACVSCHNSHPQSPKTNWKLGDVRGVLEVTIPITGMLAQGQSLANTLVFLLALVFVLVTAGIFWMFKHSVNRPLMQIAARLGQISDGGSNMFEPINYQKNDELKPVVKQFNRFVLHLKSTLSNINQQSGNLSASTDHLDKAIVDAVSLINSQHSETDQTAAAIEEMSGTVNMVAENAKTGFEQAQTTEALANEGIQVMRENQTAIRSLADEIARASEVIGRLDQDSDEIGSVVNVIRGIADQTNLLALNAAIEAARAGEQGRGFAVVADEVRTLASRTQDSTKEIQTMIERIQSGTREAVQVMQSGRSQLENSVHRTEDAAQTLDRIKKAVADIRSVNQSSSQASGEQRQAAEQINRSIHAISNLAERNADSAKAVSEGIATLRQIVNGLNGAIAKFDL